MADKELINALLTGKPYFGPAMRALQGPPHRHQYLGAILEVAARGRGEVRVLEIGSWAGASAVTWAVGIQKLGKKGNITCVDLWQPYFDLDVDSGLHYQEMNDAVKENKIFNLFLHNIRSANVSNIIDYGIGRARDVLPKLPGEAFDIVYIDGSHVYENVLIDIQNAQKLVRNGGIICGDDLELQLTEIADPEHGVRVAARKDFVYADANKVYYHPGVTEAVGAEFGEVSNWDGVWAVRKNGLKWAKVKLDADNFEVPDHIKAAMLATHRSQPGEVQLVYSTPAFNIVKTRNRFVAVAKRLAHTELFRERLGERELDPLLFIGETLDEIQQKVLKEETQAGREIAELIGETASFNLVQSKADFFAVAKRLGHTELLNERLGDRELEPVLFIGKSLDEVREKALAFEQSAEPQVRFLEELGKYNIVEAKADLIAVAKALGPINLLRERIGERDLPPLILVDTDINHLRQRIHDIECEIPSVVELT
jgi:predicted O-methyltransferase YrrM